VIDVDTYAEESCNIDIYDTCITTDNGTYVALHQQNPINKKVDEVQEALLDEERLPDQRYPVCHRLTRSREAHQIHPASHLTTTHIQPIP